MEAWILSIDWSRELQQKNLEWLDENLDSRKMPERAALMKRMGATTEEVIAWWEQYREDDEAYRPLLGLYEEHDLPKAIELVQEKRQEERITQKHWSGYMKRPAIRYNMKRNCGIIRNFRPAGRSECGDPDAVIVQEGAVFGLEHNTLFYFTRYSVGRMMAFSSLSFSPFHATTKRISAF